MRFFRASVCCALGGVILISLATNAAASSLRQIDFTATGLEVLSGDPFTPLGVQSPVQQVTGSVLFDTTAAPHFGPTQIGPTFQASRPYLAFTVNIGGAILNLSNSAATDRIFVTDAISGLGGTDFVDFGSITTQQLSPGVVLSSLRAFGFAGDDVFSDPTANVPSAAALNALNATEEFQYTLQVDGQPTASVRWTSVEWVEVSVIPIPAALPLLLTGLAGLGLIGWRRRRTA